MHNDEKPRCARCGLQSKSKTFTYLWTAKGYVCDRWIDCNQRVKRAVAKATKAVA
jgi:ribosomal protein L37E